MASTSTDAERATEEGSARLGARIRRQFRLADSVTWGSLSRNSTGPLPTTASETSLTTRERTLRQDVSLVAKYGQRLVANAHPSLGARDPAGKSVDEVRLIRDEIDRRVRALVAELVPAAV